MIKFQIELHEAHYKLLEAAAVDDYRDVRQEAAWILATTLGGHAVLAEAPKGQADTLPTEREEAGTFGATPGLPVHASSKPQGRDID